MTCISSAMIHHVTTSLAICTHDNMDAGMAGSLPDILERLKLKARRHQAFESQRQICDALAGFECSPDAGQKPTLAGALPRELGSTTTAPALTSSWLQSPAGTSLTMGMILLTMNSRGPLQPHSMRQPIRLQAKLSPARSPWEMQRVQLTPTEGHATSQRLTYGRMCTALIMRQQLQTLMDPCRSQPSHLPLPPATPSQVCFTITFASAACSTRIKIFFSGVFSLEHTFDLLQKLATQQLLPPGGVMAACSASVWTACHDFEAC